MRKYFQNAYILGPWLKSMGFGIMRAPSMHIRKIDHAVKNGCKKMLKIARKDKKGLVNKPAFSILVH